jgi:uncharacterized protein (TIGR03435 family)
MSHTGKLLLLIAAFAFAVLPLLSQTTVAPKPSFEVVSIKPSPPDNGIRGGGPRGDRFTMTGATLRMLLQVAYQRSSGGFMAGQIQIIGGPNWIDSDRYDIQAKADCSGGAISREQMQLMLQSLLEDRFQLKAHLETRELPIYDLVVAKDGPKIKASENQTPPNVGFGPGQPCAAAANLEPGPGQRGGPFDPRGPAPRGAMMMQMGTGGLTMSATAVPIANLVGLLQQQAGRQVIDKTNLKGLYDFKLQFSPEGMPTPFGPLPPGAGGGVGVTAAGPVGNTTAAPSTAAEPAPSFFTAIQEQLGLKLESTKGPVEVLVVESAQKPTEN